ncbi:glutamate carboxypeptidase II [Malassezia brasiliensis]|uniref:Glutamate carboxypeptidase II n=1 Tax=Malassezia brasiliensis TaxID=1821822 RepID=A0AAF0DX08_9BASI|nr:glutamate carboxypeptidase II [Malassezia brasiliensis]
MAYTDVDREPLLPADEKAVPPPYEELPPPVPPRRAYAKRVLLVVALVVAAVVFWHLPATERRAHACGDGWLDVLRAQVRWEDVACRVRGQTHAGACRASYDERRRDAERVFLAEPRAERARRVLQSYTEAHHFAGEKADYVSALRQLEEWRALLGLPAVEDAAALVHDAGSGASQALWKERRPRTEHTPRPRVWADTYAVWLDQPVNASLSLADAATNATVWTADLAEEVLAADPTSARGLPPFHGYSHSGAASGPLVYAGDGHKDDFARLAARGVDFRGKVVLVRYGGLFRGLKVRAAQEAGAVGVLIYSDLTEDDEVTEANGYAAYPDGPARQPSSVQRGSVQALSFYPGDPATPGVPSYRNATRLRVDEADTLPKIPSLPISYRTARRLLASLDGHGFEVGAAGEHLRGSLPGVRYWSGPSAEVVHLRNEMDLQTRDIWNVYAVIPGYIDDERIVLGNHRDAWTFGGVDPSSGTAVVHEVLSGLGALVRSGWKPMRTIVVASWDAEEYGLVGSTEFGEDYAEHVQENVAMYLNLDMAVGGSQLSAAASPSLVGLLRGAAADVPDPVSGAPLSFGDIEALGSGSDFTVFLQRLGIASLDMSYRRTRGDPVYHYHSNYDSFAWMDRFGDPGFARHEALAKVLGLTALRAAQQPFLPIDVVAYAHALRTYYDRVRAVAGGRQAHALRGLRDAIDGVVRAAERLAHTQTRLARRVQALLDDAHAPRHELRHAMRLVRRVNRALQRFERGFLDARGLPERTWYRHLGVAPGRWLGYGATTFPGVTESFTYDDGRHAAFEIARLTRALRHLAHDLHP